MKITSIRAYQVDLPLHEGSYKWSGGNSVTVFDSTVVEVQTDAGITGYGEVCPLGPAYLPAYAAGVRTGLKEIGPKLIGLDPRDLGVLNQRMDQALRGHPYVKSGIDVACWDILGKASNLPVYVLLGGAQQQDIKLYRAISQEAPEEMARKIAGYRGQGYTKFQLKVGGDPDTDIERIKACAEKLKPGNVLVADANTGWLMHQAARVVDAVKDVDVYIEQPCMTYEECRAIRDRTARPFILDEVIDSQAMVLKAAQDRAADVINLNIAVSAQSKGETLLDTVNNLSAMNADMFIVRHAQSGAAHLIAKHVRSDIHVINAGDGSHAGAGRPSPDWPRHGSKSPRARVCFRGRASTLEA